MDVTENIERVKALAAVGRARQQAGSPPLTDNETIELIELGIDLIGGAFASLAALAAQAERIADALEVANEYAIDARDAG